VIVGLLGPSRAGKDTAGAVLARELGGTCIAFADLMKRFCMQALGLTEEQLWGNSKEKPISKAQLKRFKPKWQNDIFNMVRELDSACGLDGVMCNPNNIKFMEFADGISEWLKSIADEKALAPRRVLQTFGTEFGRQHLGKNFWVNRGLETAQKVLSGENVYSRHGGLTANEGGSIRTKDAVIFTDVRFRNEVLALKGAGAKVFRAKRDDNKPRMKHASETEQDSIPDFWLDGVFFNHEGQKVYFEKAIQRLAWNIRDRGGRNVL